MDPQFGCSTGLLPCFARQALRRATLQDFRPMHRHAGRGGYAQANLAATDREDR
jgi:hypothetical protein